MKTLLAAIFAVLVGVSFVGSIYADETKKEETKTEIKSETKADGTKTVKKTTKKKKKKNGEVKVEKTETTTEKK